MVPAGETPSLVLENRTSVTDLGSVSGSAASWLCDHRVGALPLWLTRP